MTIIQAVAGIGQPADPNFNNVALLLKDNGTNGAQNNTFLDSSSNNFTITRNGDTTQGAFTPYVPNGYWSNYFDGTGDYLTTSSSSTATGDFTYEAWIYQTVSAVAIILTNGNESSGRTYMYVTSGQQLGWGVYAVADYTLGGSVPLNQWNHIAIVRSGTTVTGYVNGAALVTTTSYSGTAGNVNGFAVGANKSGGSTFTGYISNARIVNGTALYTANFTPPTAPLTAVTNTSLLTCQSNRFIDNSSNAFAITATGTPRVTAFQPFPKTSIYSPTAYGGSGYFDGAGDSLTVPAGSAFAPGTGDFTVEGWFYPTATPTAYQYNLYTQTVSGVNYFVIGIGYDTSSHSNKYVEFFGTLSGGGVAIYSATQYNLFSWNHFAVVRSSGTVTVYLNGVGGTPTTNNTNFSNTTYVPTIGAYTHTASQNFFGYLSNFRYIKGTALYTANFTPPTSPVTNITNTSLLCNFTNAGIFDATTINDLQTVGNAQVSTTQAKYGATSLYFDGTGDYLVLPDNPLWDLRGDFTIETWVYLTNYSSSYVGQYGVCIVANYFYIAGSSNQGWQLRINGTASAYNVINVYTGTTDLNFTSATVNLNTWTHIAISRSGSSIRAFVNGTQVGSTITNSDTFTEANSRVLRVGQLNDANYLFPMIGYLQDLRITPGLARYTANFTPPVAPFPPR